MDVERPTVFGFSGYRGTKPFLGAVDGRQFRVLQRVYSNRNTLSTVLTGEFEPQENGARVKGAFDLEAASKMAVCVISFVGLLILVPIVFVSHASHPVFSAIFVCVYGSLLLFLPRIFRGIGLDQERDIADFPKETLAADDDA